MSLFDSIPLPKLKSSKFNLSEEVKLSCNIGELVPICMKEVLPGDKFRINTETLIKFAPLKAPVMHRLSWSVHYFFVPIFQLTNVFEKFINPKINSDNSVILPTVSLDEIDHSLGSLADYLGLPILNQEWVESFPAISALPFMAYQHIYNSYYRDQNLELLESEGGTLTPNVGLFNVESYKDIQGDIAGPADYTCLGTLRKRAWKKDYFTSALPSPQAGDDVLIPISPMVSSDGVMEFSAHVGEGPSGTWPVQLQDGKLQASDPESLSIDLEYKKGIKVGEASTTINNFRRAMVLQGFKERSERGGTRYSEYLKSAWHTFIPDYWVDRPLYLGGQRGPISIGEVVQTSQTTSGDDASAQGMRAGISNNYGQTRNVKLSAPCHGFLVGIFSIRPEATYQQGLERMWTRKSLFDYADPMFANIGEQEIFNREIFATGNEEKDNAVFGYTPRYAEYKEGHCHVCGEFRDSLQYWHFGRVFESVPNLSKEFVMMDNVSTEPFNVIDDEQEHIYVDVYNHIIARRNLPYYGVPKVL